MDNLIIRGYPKLYLSQEQRVQVAIDMCSRIEPAQEIANWYESIR